MMLDKLMSFKLCLLQGSNPPEVSINYVAPSIRKMGSEPASKIKALKHILIHRNTVARTGVELAEWFNKPGPYKSKCPYHFLVRRDGQVDWCVDLDKATPGAKNANSSSIQIAVDWDMHLSIAPDAVYNALVGITCFVKLLCPEADIQGHMEQDPLGRSNDPKKDCPGKHLDMVKLRKEVKEYLNA